MSSPANPVNATDGGGAGSRALTGATGHPSPARGRVGATSLWFGLCGGALAWSVLTIANYAIAAQVCYPQMVPLTTPKIGRGPLALILLVVAAGAILVSMIAAMVSLRNWRRTQDESQGDTHWALDTGEGRTRFMAVSSLMTSAVFLLAILVHTSAILFVSPCW